MKWKLFMALMFPVVFANAQNAVESILRGNQYYQQSQFNLAEAQYRKALNYEPDNEKAKYNLANALQKQNKLDEAAKLLDDLTESTKDESLKSASYYNQGVAYSKMKKLDESIEAYKQSLRLKPDDQEARENLEKALLQKKNQNKNTPQKKPSPAMSQKEAQQKLDMLNQKEKQLRQKNDRQKPGKGQAEDW